MPVDIAIPPGTLDSSARTALQDQEMLLRLGGELPRFDDERSLILHVSTELAMYLELDGCSFTENDHARGEFVLHADFNRSGRNYEGVYPLSEYTPRIRQELERGHVVTIADAASDPRTLDVYATRYEPISVRALASVPLMRDGRWIASFLVAASTVHAWTTREVQMLQALTERTWLWVEHIRMLRALRASERKYRHFIESTHEGVWEIDATACTVFVNPRMAALMGYSAEEMLGAPLTSFLDDEGRTLAARELERRRAGVSESHDFRFQRKDGSAWWAHLETSPLIDEAGAYRGALAMVSDVTERRQAEQDQQFLLDLAELLTVANEPGVALREAARSLGMHLGVDHCLFTEFDPAMVTASTLHEWHGAAMPTLSGDHALAGFRSALPDLFKGRGVVIHDARFDERVAADYEAAYAPLNIRATVAVPMHKDGQLVAALVLVMRAPHNWTPREVSLTHATVERVALCVERLQNIAALRDISKQLERGVRERTGELTAALKEKEVLLKEIHHRVKNNLQVISSMLNLQAMHITDPAMLSVLEESRGRVHSIALVHETLYESQDLSRVKFVDYIHTLVNRVLHAQGRAECHVSTVIDAANVHLPVGTAIPCGLIINELVTNSLKHAFAQRTRGEIRVSLSSPKPEWVELSVSDDGVGLPKELNPRHVTSLGLDLVYTFAEQLGAQVEVESTHGTRFRFVFPEG